MAPNPLRRLLWKPGVVMAQVAEHARAAWVAILLTVVLASLWSVFLLLLAREGQQPSGPTALPIDKSDYYFWEAWFGIPVRILMMLAAAAVLRWVAAGSQQDGFSKAMVIAAIATALPSLVAWLIPDVLVWLALGFEALATWMRYYVPICLLWMSVLLFVGVRTVYRVGRTRALLASLLALLVYGAVGSPFLR